jgi:hypothetical protein
MQSKLQMYSLFSFYMLVVSMLSTALWENHVIIASLRIEVLGDSMFENTNVTHNI